MRRMSNVFYQIFNWACILIYGYQVFLWIRRGFWTKIPSAILLPGSPAWQSAGGSGPLVRALSWICHVELAYTLCAIAMVFYGLRWMTTAKAQSK